MKPKLHLLGIPHTQTTDEFSHCAFTGKVKRFSPMLRSVGYDVIHYGVGGADSGATLDVEVMNEEEWTEIRTKLLKELYPTRDISDKSLFIGDLASSKNELYEVFNDRLRYFLRKHLDSTDIICLPFGPAHEDAVFDLPNPKVETGIGYTGTYYQYRVYESYAWYHYDVGVKNLTPNDYWWVIPNYFDLSSWELNLHPKRYVAYFGRLGDMKGLNIVTEIARHRPDLMFVICGQGDPTPYLTLPNIIYKSPIHGKERSDFLGNAMAVVMPTRYLEPFGGVTVEANLCGTPVLGSSYGSFTETIDDNVNGFRCHTLGDYLAALEVCENGRIDRTLVRQRAERYDMYKLAHKYDEVFNQINDLHANGWYTLHSHKFGPVTSAVNYKIITEKSMWANKLQDTFKTFKETEHNRTVLPTVQRLLTKANHIRTPLATELGTVLEVGGGPESPLLLYNNIKRKLIVDPIYYGAEVDHAYSEAGIIYIGGTIETLSLSEPIDEVWFINSLQFVENPKNVLDILHSFKPSTVKIYSDNITPIQRDFLVNTIMFSLNPKWNIGILDGNTEMTDLFMTLIPKD